MIFFILSSFILDVKHLIILKGKGRVSPPFLLRKAVSGLALNHIALDAGVALGDSLQVSADLHHGDFRQFGDSGLDVGGGQTFAGEVGHAPFLGDALTFLVGGTLGLGLGVGLLGLLLLLRGGVLVHTSLHGFGQVECLGGLGVLGVLDGGFDDSIHGLAVLVLDASIEGEAVLLGNGHRDNLLTQSFTQGSFNGGGGGDTNFTLHGKSPSWFVEFSFSYLFSVPLGNILIVSHLAVFVKGFFKLFLKKFCDFMTHHDRCGGLLTCPLDTYYYTQICGNVNTFY